VDLWSEPAADSGSHNGGNIIVGVKAPALAAESEPVKGAPGKRECSDGSGNVG